MKKLLLGVIAGLVFAGIGVLPALAVVELPDPGTVLPDGSTIATLHDDFYAYSAKLNTLLGYPGFNVPTGTGGLDILVYTGANGQDNDPVNGGFVFPDPMQDPGGSVTTFSGVWGTQDPDHDPILVDDVLGYLHTFGPDINIPVFDFDMNQTGANPDLDILGRVYILDPSNGNSTVAEWDFDDILNNTFDADAWVTATGVIDLGGGLSVDHNKGSGKLDYIGIAPTMDLSLYSGKDYTFYADFRMRGLNDGFEELYLSGAFAPQHTLVPEPATMALFGLGLAGVIARKRRKLA
ncbi:MAG: PEP-CTERM sorting domain-containing protein [Deltaproteobacteria bacterium]